MRKLFIVAAFVAALATSAPALAADVTLFGTAQAEPGDVKLVSEFSDVSTANDAGGVSFANTGVTTFSSITTLGTDFNVTDDDCGGGSPRFQIQVGGKNVFVYLGPAPSFTGCSQNTWLSSGNLVGTSDACRVDTSQLAGGTQCTTWAAAVTLVGAQQVTGIQLVADGGWKQADKEQSVLVRNVRINGASFITPAAPPSGHLNPAKLCSAQRALIGDSAFRELWGRNANDANAFGKCVSAMAHLKQHGQDAILAAVRSCTADGLHGARLGACVSERDGLQATRADRADGGHGKAKEHKKRK
jgi:hypothetical protein